MQRPRAPLPSDIPFLPSLDSARVVWSVVSLAAIITLALRQTPFYTSVVFFFFSVFCCWVFCFVAVLELCSVRPILIACIFVEKGNDIIVLKKKTQEGDLILFFQFVWVGGGGAWSIACFVRRRPFNCTLNLFSVLRVVCVACKIGMTNLVMGKEGEGARAGGRGWERGVGGEWLGVSLYLAFIVGTVAILVHRSVSSVR